MAHPTDDELEIRALTLNEIARVKRSGTVLERELADMLDRTAAALHACKGRVRVDTHTVASEVFKAIVWGAQSSPPPYGAAYPSYTRSGNSDAETEARVIAARILAALEPAPDHSEWNAAIEAAAKVVPQGWCQSSTSHIEMDVDLGQGIQAAIRALKKGPRSDDN